MKKDDFKALLIESLKEDENFKKEIFSILSPLIVDSASFDINASKVYVESTGDYGNTSSSEVIDDIYGITLSFPNTYVFDKLHHTEYNDIFNSVISKYYPSYNLEKSIMLFSTYCSKMIFHDIPDIKIFEKNVDVLIKSSLKYTSNMKDKNDNNQLIFLLNKFIEIN